MNVRTPSRSVLLAVVILALASGCAAPTPSGASLTGLPELDAIIAAAQSDDPGALVPFFEYTRAACTSAEGLGGPPKCLPGEAEGAVVEVLPLLGPEGSFLRKADVNQWEGLSLGEIHAVYEVSDAAYRDENYPAGEHALVFNGKNDSSTSVTLQVRAGRIVRIDYGLNRVPEIRPEDVSRYLVSPR